MHREHMDRVVLTGVERGISSQQFLAELHDRGLRPDEAADVLSAVFGVPRGAARLFVRSHPAWASQGPDRAGGFPIGKERGPCW